ncbi:MAG TPA: hypothetical protein VFH76_23195 [Kribbella sp.]|nr:hypothetical protein [Kribbella sp.]
MRYVRRVAGMLRDFDDKFAAQAARRPGWKKRLVALAIFLFALYGLTGAKHWHEALSAAAVCLWAALYVVAPRGLYDGRFVSWSQTHTVRSALVFALFMSAAGYLALSGIADDWKFVLFIAVALTATMVVRQIAGRLATNADGGPASGVDGGPPSRT